MYTETKAKCKAVVIMLESGNICLRESTVLRDTVFVRYEKFTTVFLQKNAKTQDLCLHDTLMPTFMPTSAEFG